MGSASQNREDVEYLMSFASFKCFAHSYTIFYTRSLRTEPPAFPLLSHPLQVFILLECRPLETSRSSSVNIGRPVHELYPHTVLGNLDFVGIQVSSSAGNCSALRDGLSCSAGDISAVLDGRLRWSHAYFRLLNIAGHFCCT